MDQVEEIRSKIDIVDFINSYVPLKRAGRNFRALCPFHSEKTPSFIVSPELQIFKCFGCGKAGSVYQFLAEYEGMSFPEALQFLAEKTGVKLERLSTSEEYQQRKILLEINHLATEFYHFLLTKHQVGEKARQYLLKRGINNFLIKKFKLGYAPDNWDSLIRYLVVKKKYKPVDLEKAGLVIKGKELSATSYKLQARNYYDRFRGRIIFPLADHQGNFVGFAGRTLLPDERKAKYINTPETMIYHKSKLLYGLNQMKSEIKKKNQTVLVEGETDAISSFQAGVKNVVAIKGSAATEDQLRLLRRFCENLVFALDADLAGDEAVRRAIQVADKLGFNIKVAKPLFGKDPDECAQHSPKLWQDSVKKAVNIYDFYLDSAKARFETKTIEGKRKISQEVIPLISPITNQVVKAYYIRKLAQVLGVSEEVVGKEMERLEKEAKIKGGMVQKIPRDSFKDFWKKDFSRQEKLEEYLLSLFLRAEKIPKDFLERLKEKKFKSLVIKNIIGKMKQFLKDKEEFKIKAFVKILPEELKKKTADLYLAETEVPINWQKEAEKTLKELEKLALFDKLRNLRKKIKTLEGKDAKSLKKFQEKINETLKQLKNLNG